MAVPGSPSGNSTFNVQSNGQRVALLRQNDGQVALQMPAGSGFGFKSSPLDLAEPHACAWIGNPQLIIEVPDVDAVDLPIFAPPLRHHARFHEGTNVCIVQILEPGRARIRSWERGVEGETLSCGTGSAVAGAWLARRTGMHVWEFQPRGRDLVRVEADIGPDGDWETLWLSGPVHRVGVFEPATELISIPD